MAKKEKQEIEKKEKRIYTIEELKKLDVFLEKYKTKRCTRKDGTGYFDYDWDQIFIKSGCKTFQREGYALAVVVIDLPEGGQDIPLLRFENMLDQWTKWRFGNIQKMEAYEKTAKEIAEDDFNNW